VTAAPLVETASFSQLAMSDDFEKLIVVALGSATFPEVVHFDLATKTATPLFEGVGEHLASLGPEVPSIFALDSLSYRGSFATLVVNGYSDAAYWRGNKNAYVADLETGASYAVGLAPSDIEALASEADAASPGAATTYFPTSGDFITGDGWQFQSARATKSGSVGPFTVLVPESEWRALD
jgi:hypothetical protein